MAAWYFRRSTRDLNSRERWEAGAQFEAAHWDDQWFDRAIATGLLDPQRPIQELYIRAAIDRIDPALDPVRILDVGAGPLTPVGMTAPGRAVAVTACDALAREYADILAARGITPPVVTVFAEGETLEETFEPGDFDIVHCANALDHHYEPWRALESMLALTPPHGVLLLNHYANEGEHQRYLGLHQWNIDARDGQLMIWNKSTTINVNEGLAGRADVSVSVELDAEINRTRVIAAIRPI